jgi:hypothetical protein
MDYGSVNATASNQDYDPVVHNIAPVSLTWRNLSVTTLAKKNCKVLLKNISGQITGGFWAVMGSSGSGKPLYSAPFLFVLISFIQLLFLFLFLIGKTTLLSTLALRIDRMRMTVTGDMRLNGRKYNKSYLKNMSG